MEHPGRKKKWKRIAWTDDLHLAVRDDGATYGTPTWIWSAVVENELYVRPHNWNFLTLVQSCDDPKTLVGFRDYRRQAGQNKHFRGIYFRIAGDSTAIGTRRRSSTQLQQANF